MPQQSEFQREQIIDAWTLVGRSLGMLVASVVVSEAPIVANVFPEQQVLNVKQAAKYIGYGVTKFKELRDSGKITAVKNSDAARPRFYKADLDRFLAQQKKAR